MTSSCNSCGICCKLFLINLSQKEYKSGDYQTIFQNDGIIEKFNQARDCGANLLAKKDDGTCVYLSNKKCSIHNTRPRVCRHFFCTSQNKKFKGMIEIINKEKTK